MMKPTYFITFSTGEPHVDLLKECLDIVFGKQYRQVVTPSALESGHSQHDVILRCISEYQFGVVCLDGFRPNVVFEYGAMRGAGKSLLIFKEHSATVDITHFFSAVASLSLTCSTA
jgi:hypothetical protein